MSSIFYQTGNTIRLECIFKDFEGHIVRPAIVKITFYDTGMSITNTINDEIQVKESDIYYYDFTPVGDSQYNSFCYYEWYGETNDGKVSVKRGSIRTKFL